MDKSNMNKHKYTHPLVSVVCLTYNQEDTIADALEGMLMQETSFPFEIIVHDDASTDRTSDIVKEYAKKYPDIIRPILQSVNQYHLCNIAKTHVNPLVRGKYVAICEGDDYWTDSRKLARQIRIMRRHPEISMCFHAVSQQNPDGSAVALRPFRRSTYVSTETIITKGGMFCPTVSMVFRKDVLDCWPAFRDMAAIYDFPSQILAALEGKIYYLDRNMAVYRFCSPGSWTRDVEAKPDLDVVRNEEGWMNELDSYTRGKYHAQISEHILRCYLNQYIKFDVAELYDGASKRLDALNNIKRIKYTILLLSIRLGGRPMRIAGQKLKQIMKKL